MVTPPDRAANGSSQGTGSSSCASCSTGVLYIAIYKDIITVHLLDGRHTDLYWPLP